MIRIFGKFNARSKEGIFVGFVTHKNTYRVYNKSTKIIED